MIIPNKPVPKSVAKPATKPNTKETPKLIAKSFSARLERTASRLNWVLIHIPLDVAKVWGTRGQLRVKGEINGFGFRTSLFPTGKGTHIMIVNKRMQAEGNVRPGAIARFRLEPDTAARIASVPAEFKRILAQNGSLRRWFEQLSYSMRNEISKWITQVKSVEARVRRAEQIAERLMATMEAERVLPPVLQLTFAQDARAREGWQRMSPSRRRGHLLGIFHYRDPEARDRRVAKTVQDAVALFEKSANRGARTSQN